MENSSLLGFTSGRDEVYHVEIPARVKELERHCQILRIFISLRTMSIHLAAWINKPMWNPCCQEAKILKHFISLDSFKQKVRDLVHTENTEGSGLEVGISRNDGESWSSSS